MELIYLRIFDTHNNDNLSFLNKDINFYGEHQLYFDSNTRKIVRSDDNNYFSNLYGPNIKVTGIVGANGVGKTTFLKFLQYLIAKLNDVEAGHSYIFDTWEWVAVTNQEGGLHTVSSALIDMDYAHELKLELTKNPIDIKGVNTKIANSLSTSVFYCPHINFSEPNFDKPDYIDVSTDFLMYKESRSKEEDNQNTSQTIHFSRNDIKRQIDFIQLADDVGNEHIKFYTKFKRDEINIRFHEFSKHFDNDARYIDFNDSQIYKELDKNFIGRNSTIIYQFRREKSDATNELCLLRFYRRLIEIIYNCIEYRPEPKQDDKGDFLPQITDNFIVDSHNITANFEAFFSHLVIFEKSKHEQFLNLIERIKIIFNENLKYYKSDDVFQTSLTTAQELIIIEKNIFSLLPYSSNLELFNFEWGGMSTGEKAYLNLFSRLNHGLNLLQTHEKIKEADLIYFLIDEPAAGFHPQWQKEYLFKLLEYLKVRVECKFHIIISSHSPFLISDLQEEDVIALSSGNQSYNSENTFGANIHELLADSFFLQNGFIGDFAKNKIEDLLNYLIFDENMAVDATNVKPKEAWDDDNAQKIIKIIGEPLIKNRLQELYDEKFKSITELELQIKQIEGLIRKKKQ